MNTKIKFVGFALSVALTTQSLFAADNNKEKNLKTLSFSTIPSFIASFEKDDDKLEQAIESAKSRCEELRSNLLEQLEITAYYISLCDDMNLSKATLYRFDGSIHIYNQTNSEQKKSIESYSLSYDPNESLGIEYGNGKTGTYEMLGYYVYSYIKIAVPSSLEEHNLRYVEVKPEGDEIFVSASKVELSNAIYSAERRARETCKRLQDSASSYANEVGPGHVIRCTNFGSIDATTSSRNGKSISKHPVHYDLKLEGWFNITED